METKFRCPHCGVALVTVAAEKPGDTVPCPACAAALVIPRSPLRAILLAAGCAAVLVALAVGVYVQRRGAPGTKTAAEPAAAAPAAPADSLSGPPTPAAAPAPPVPAAEVATEPLDAAAAAGPTSPPPPIAQAATGQVAVAVDVGDRRETVIARLGHPRRRMAARGTEFLTYAQAEIELTNGVVARIKCRPDPVPAAP